MNTASTDDIAGLVRPSLSHLGIDLVDVQWSGRGRGALLRLIIDRPGGVTLDDCERVSNAAGAVLDAYDLIDSAYRLEVSSPGAERPLRTREDWLQALGRRINVRMRSGEGEAIVEGRLLALSDGSAEVEVRERHRARVVPVTLDNVIAARIAVDI